MKNMLTNWFYKTDFILDEGSLDDFHDKKVVRKQAGKLASLIYFLMFASFALGALIF